MRLLGIDYGTKRVGLALSDESGRLAFPHSVLTNDQKLLTKIKEICEAEKVAKIILGESKNFQGQDNPVMVKIRDFKTKLEQAINIPVSWEPEFLTSAAAERIVGKDRDLDARAAALILQSYLDKSEHARMA